MLTVFAVPKPFRDHIGMIQWNAIASWTRLHPDAEVILFGEEDGTAAAAEALGATHIPDVARNQYGTPLVSDLFAKAAAASRQPVLAYVNADIILMQDFVRAVQAVARVAPRFLITGRRQDIVVTRPLNFASPWEQSLKQQVIQEARSTGGLDVFAFPKRLWGWIPPFAVGRGFWDTWPPYGARLRKAIVVDVTPSVTIVHQNHDYAHQRGGKAESYGGSEALDNLALISSLQHCFLTTEATHVLDDTGLRVRCRSCHPVCVCRPSTF